METEKIEEFKLEFEKLMENLKFFIEDRSTLVNQTNSPFQKINQIMENGK